MKKEEIRINTNSFEINKLITTTKFFSQIELMLSSRLVLRCITDYWNYKKGYSYPTQKTIAECTGLSEVSVGQAVKELELKQIIKKDKVNKRIYYRYTISFFGYLGLMPKVTLGDTISSLGNIPQAALDKNILKEKENTSLLNSSSDVEFTEQERIKMTIKAFVNNPAFKKYVDDMKEKLDRLAEM